MGLDGSCGKIDLYSWCGEGFLTNSQPGKALGLLVASLSRLPCRLSHLGEWMCYMENMQKRLQLYSKLEQWPFEFMPT